MYKWMYAVAMILIICPAFALESTNCSDAFGSFRRIDLGSNTANPVSFRVGGQVVGDAQTIDATEIGARTVISKILSSTANATTTIYVTTLQLSRKDKQPIVISEDSRDQAQNTILKDNVICEHYLDSNLN